MKIRHIVSIVPVVVFSTITGSVWAVDLKALQNECSELGFQVKTEDNANCVLQLLDKVRKKAVKKVTIPDDVNAAYQRTIERQRQYAKDADIVQRQREIDQLNRQQAEMLELQKRAVAAQEGAVNQQNRANSFNMMLQGLQMMQGTGTYARPAPRQPVTCTTFGNVTTCN